MTDELYRNSERRGELRIPARLEVSFGQARDAAKAFRAFSVNFSPGGLCVRTSRPHQVGDRMTVKLAVDGQAFELEAAVQWVRGPVVGLRFEAVPAEDKVRLEQVAEVLQQRPPPEDEDLGL